MIGHKAILKIVAFGVFNALLAGILVESLILGLLHSPRLTAASPQPVRRLVQQIYRHFNRALIQFDPHCARYDAELAYTLKSGTCTFENIEFRTEVHINRFGLRDDEASLEAPEVIVLGDSHAMGWGVEQEQTLGRVLARKSGLKVLNAAVSSYGTVREMMLLERLDVSRLRVLIVQYSDNDLLENRTFREHGNRLPIVTEPKYHDVVQYYARQRSYYPGKYLYRLLMKVSRLELPEPEQLAMEPATPTDEAKLFINALIHAGRAPLHDVHVIVFEVNEPLQQRRAFLVALEGARQDSANPPFVKELTTMDVSSFLTPSHFFVLDDHMNVQGHQAVGEALGERLRARR